MNQRSFAQSLRINKGLIACDEVDFYGCRADVLAINTRAETIIEYEFKNNSQDLKVREPKKSKYKIQCRRYKNDWRWHQSKKHKGCINTTVFKEPQKPNQFYFVMPVSLWEKEEEYIRSLGVHIGAIAIRGNGDFYVEKRSRIRMKNLQKYSVAVQSILRRLANVYAWDKPELKGE